MGGSPEHHITPGLGGLQSAGGRAGKDLEGKSEGGPCFTPVSH